MAPDQEPIRIGMQHFFAVPPEQLDPARRLRGRLGGAGPRLDRQSPAGLSWSDGLLGPGRLPFSVGATPLGFGVDDPAARGGRLQTLGLGSARLAAPLVASGRALVQL
jgi:hypothetical protein